MRAVSRQAPLPGDVRSVTAAPQLPAAARHSPPGCARTGEDAARPGLGGGRFSSPHNEIILCRYEKLGVWERVVRYIYLKCLIQKLK